MIQPTCVIEVNGLKWVPASTVLTESDRLGLWAGLLPSGLTWAYMIDGQLVFHPTLGEIDRAQQFEDAPWGKTLIPLEVASAIDEWRNTHSEWVLPSLNH